MPNTTMESALLHQLAARFSRVAEAVGDHSIPHTVTRFADRFSTTDPLELLAALGSPDSPIPTQFQSLATLLLTLPSLPPPVRDALALSIHVEGPQAGASLVQGGGTLFLSQLFQAITLSLREAVAQSVVSDTGRAGSADFLRTRLTDLRSPGTIRRPGEYSEIAQDIYKAAKKFADENIFPNWQRIESGDLDFQRHLFKKAGEAGLIGALIPAAYGGSDLDIEQWAALIEGIVSVDSFTTGLTGSMGIGNQAITYFGTEEQKQHYLPAIASGDLIGVFALTEPGSGSDAFGSMKTTATEEVRDGQRVWVVRGSKQFITNPAFPNSVMTVFAKVNGQVSTFIVETQTPGVTVGKPEDKLGQHGSNTCTVTFDDVVIPYENLIGNIGEGKKIAMTTLNRGRLLLGIASAAKAVELTKKAVAWTLERQQFNTPTAHFGLVQQQLLPMALDAWAAQRMTHRVIGDVQRRFEEIDRELGISADTSGDNPERDRHQNQKRQDRRAKVLQEFELEFSILKVIGSEVYGNNADSFVQVMGGYGYMAEYPAARALRDSRIGRIYEGTTEINQLRIAEGILKLINPKNIEDAIVAGTGAEEIAHLIQAIESHYDTQHPLYESARQTLRALEMLGAAHATVQKIINTMRPTDERQFLINELSRMAMAAFKMDSVLRATLQDIQTDPRASQTAINTLATQHVCHNTLAQMLENLNRIRDYLPADFDASALNPTLFSHSPRFDRMSIEKQLAAHLLEHGSF